MAASRTFRPALGSLTRSLVTLVGSWTTTTGGAVGTTTADGWTVARTSAGLYTITLKDVYALFWGCDTTIIAANAPYTAGKGIAPTVTAVNLASRTFQIQFGRANGTTDYNNTDVEDGASVSLVITLSNAPRG